MRAAMGASVGEGVWVAGCGWVISESGRGLQPTTSNDIQKIRIILDNAGLGSTGKIITEKFFQIFYYGQLKNQS
jgi:hypothetical protein